MAATTRTAGGAWVTLRGLRAEGLRGEGKREHRGAAGGVGVHNGAAGMRHGSTQMGCMGEGHRKQAFAGMEWGLQGVGDTKSGWKGSGEHTERLQWDRGTPLGATGWYRWRQCHKERLKGVSAHRDEAGGTQRGRRQIEWLYTERLQVS